MAAAYLEDLNPAQIEAVTHGEGPLLIVAGAGTGKTKTLACRVAHLIDQGVAPDRILLLTFTRRASSELLGRAGQFSATEAAGGVWGGTFHSVANRLLRRYGRAVGLPREFTVCDQSDAQDLMNLVRQEKGVAKGDRRFPRKQTLVSIYSRMASGQDKLATVLERHFPWCVDDTEGIKPIFEAYTERKRRDNVLDYDDLLLFWSALCDAPETGDTVAGLFDHVLVDEYQDTNAIQAEILHGMRKHCDNICVVGDDAQSIYSFRAATVRNILDFPEHFPGTRVVTLEQNYRSTPPILAASNAVMSYARERYTKELWSARDGGRKPVLFTCIDDAEQSKTVVDLVIEHLEESIPLTRQAVLFRTGHHSAQLEVELARRNVPFHKYGGLKFVEAAHIKDLLAILRIAENPFDEISWFRVLLLLKGIGPRSARRILDALGVGADRSEASGETLPAPIRHLLAEPPDVPAGAREQFDRLRTVLAECRGLPAPGKSKKRKGHTTEEPSVGTQVERVRDFYEPIFHETYDNAKIRLRDLEQLEQIALRYRSRSRFLTDLTLDPPTSTSDLAGPPYLEEDYLILSTIHSAKGCEWDVVHVIHATDGMIPSDMATRDEESIDEERRLFYVAMTRAKDMLYIHVPLRYYHTRSRTSDAHGYAQRTRFITQQDRSFYEPRAKQVEGLAGFPALAARSRNVRGRLEQLWKDE